MTMSTSWIDFDQMDTEGGEEGEGEGEGEEDDFFTERNDDNDVYRDDDNIKTKGVVDMMAIFNGVTTR